MIKMEVFIGYAILLTTALFVHKTSGAEVSAEPIAVVNARMDAYNHHDIDAFLELYSQDIQVFTFPNVALGPKGKEHLLSIFEPMFKEGKVGVKVHQQITQGRYVINHETVTYNGESQKYVSIYEVENGLITSVQFVRE